MKARTHIQNAKVVGDNISHEAYHPQAEGVVRGDPRWVMSRGELAEFSKCPERWKAGVESDETKSTEWGSLMDALILQAERADDLIAVCPETYENKKGGESEWSRKSEYCREWEDERTAQGKLVVRAKVYAEAQAALKALASESPVAKRARAYISTCKRQVMVTAEYKDPTTDIVVPLKALIDLVPDKDSAFGWSLGDFKTAVNAAVRVWSKACGDHHYHTQGAMYTDLWNAAAGEERTEFRHIIQENSHPWQLGTRVLSADFVEIGRTFYLEQLRRYCQCLKTGEWPDYEPSARWVTEGWSVIEPLPYMIEKAFE